MNEQEEIAAEIGKHLIQPENYGKLEDANCTGVAVDHAGKSYVIMYIKRDENTILDVMFGTNDSDDITTLGSIFTEMIKGDDIESVNIAVKGLEDEVREMVNSNITADEYNHSVMKHQDNANMVILSFRAAMRHYERQQEGIEEEQFEMSLVKACPPSSAKACQMK